MMIMNRRAFLAAGMGAAAAAAAGNLTAGTAAATVAGPRAWVLSATAFGSLSDPGLDGSPQVCQNAFNHGSTWFTTSYAGPGTPTPVPDGFTGVAALYFAAYDDSGGSGLVQAIAHGLPPWVQAVEYDPEEWTATPETEQGAFLVNPATGISYAQDFCGTAHAHGLKVMLVPSGNLCNNDPNPAYGNQPQYPLEPGETSYHAYVRYDLASAAQWLLPGDMYIYQAQALETTPSLYGQVTAQVARQVTAAGSGVIMTAALGRTGADWDHATAAQLEAAASAVNSVTGGLLIHADADTTRVSRMITFLHSLGY